MTSEETAPPSVPVAVGAESPFRRLVGVFVSPARTFASIAGRPTWLLPLAIAAGLALPLSELILSRTDFRRLITAQVAKRGQHLTESQIDNAVERMRRLSWLGDIAAVLLPAILTLAVAGVLWAACQAFGWEVRFRQSLGVTAHAFLPSTIGSLVLLGALWSRDTIDPQAVGDVLHTNLGFLVDARADPLLHGLLSSIDLFSFWAIGLLVLGLSAAAKTSRARMAALVGSLWALFVLGKTGVAALMP